MTTTTDRPLPLLLAGFARAALSLHTVALRLAATADDAAVCLTDVRAVLEWANLTRAVACEAYDAAQLHHAVERLHGAKRAVDAQITLHAIGDARRIARAILVACAEADDGAQAARLADATARLTDAQRKVYHVLGACEELATAAARLAAAHR